MTFHVEPHRGRARREPWEFRLMFAVTFAAMLLPATFAWLTSTEPGAKRKSIAHEARARADRIVPFMFMG